ncbi:MAG: cupin domain-containing protein [Ignavibacteria bacterium]|jgi:cupin 2 domain-containing protein|nr:cupin domain-containing protein [Ignavibacteria bacterium]MBK6877660.1 cupin domain-containing protein [Ignavibacteria bacterium]MBK9227393.1 cupin domain-containing protein [Ignavibacteria bacterium]
MKEILKGNIFENAEAEKKDFEIFEALAESDHALVERIISSGQKTPDGQWLQQDRNEWVMLLKGNARISFADGFDFELNPGDHLFIPRDKKHRVTHTSADPECIWIAFHFE